MEPPAETYKVPGPSLSVCLSPPVCPDVTALLAASSTES